MADLQRKTYNLFDGVIEQGTWDATKSPIKKEDSQTRCRTSDFIDVTENAEYAISLNNAGSNIQYVIHFLNGSKGKISEVGWSTAPISFTTPNGCQYIDLIFKNTAGTAISPVNCGLLMVNEGSTPRSYEPYGWLHSLRKLTTATDTITTLPANLYADGNNATVGISGNTVQSGTPTPQNPIQPSECGDRTGNLWDGAIGLDNTQILQNDGTTITSPNYALSDYIPVSASTSYVYSFRHNQYEPNRTSFTVSFYKSDKQLAQRIVLQNINDEGIITIPFTTPADTKYVRINWKKPYDDMLMLNLGETALPYEPYGVKIPISSASTTTPVYLGEVPTTRKIKKYEFTGQETIYSVTETLDTQGLYCFIYQYASLGMTDIIYNDSYMAAIPYPFFVSSHFINKSSDKRASFKNISVGEIGANSVTSGVQNSFLIMCVSGITSAAGFKQWLAAQYAAGTPVTVWYVLATPTTGIVNEPLRKIGNYADTVSGISIPTMAGADSFDVLTTLKPSEVTVNYHGWHTGAVHERDSGQWD